jgi:DNA-binding Lrp family transcriptional regulator
MDRTTFDDVGVHERVDELDSVILRELQQDARLTNKDLAARLGVAPSTCLERVRRLRQQGAIRGYHADISPQALGRVVQALVAVTVRPLRRANIDAFQDDLSGQPEVMSIFVLAGGDDFLVHIGVPTIEQLHAFLIDRLSARQEVVGFRTSTIFRHARKSVLEPLAGTERSSPSALS